MLDDCIMDAMKCIFCAEEVRDRDHFEQHNNLACASKDALDRAFARKDLLKQHVQQVHLCTSNEYMKRGFRVPELWVRDVDSLTIKPDAVWCGFCQCRLVSTKVRMEHVAQHFRDGVDLTTWVHCSAV